MEYLLSSLLDSKNKSVLDIFKIISSENRWYGAKEVGDQLALSERTIQRQFNSLFEFTNEFISEDKNDFSLLFKKNKGVYLKTTTGNSYSVFVSKLFENDDNIKILKLILLDKSPSVSQYASENYLSVNYVRNSICKINRLLQKFNFVYSVSSKKL